MRIRKDMLISVLTFVFGILMLLAATILSCVNEMDISVIICQVLCAMCLVVFFYFRILSLREEDESVEKDAISRKQAIEELLQAPISRVAPKSETRARYFDDDGNAPVRIKKEEPPEEIHETVTFKHSYEEKSDAGEAEVIDDNEAYVEKNIGFPAQADDMQLDIAEESVPELEELTGLYEDTLVEENFPISEIDGDASVSDDLHFGLTDEITQSVIRETGKSEVKKGSDVIEERVPEMPDYSEKQDDPRRLYTESIGKVNTEIGRFESDVLDNILLESSISRAAAAEDSTPPVSEGDIQKLDNSFAEAVEVPEENSGFGEPPAFGEDEADEFGYAEQLQFIYDEQASAQEEEGASVKVSSVKFGIASIKRVKKHGKRNFTPSELKCRRIGK